MSLGFGEIVIGLVLLLLLFGGKRLPALGKSLGQSITNFKKGLNSSSNDESDNDKNSPS